MRASTIAKGYTFYLGTGPTMTVMVQPDGATETGSYELTTFLDEPGMGHPTETAYPAVTVLTSEVCALVTTQMCSAIEVTQTLSASQPMITETAGTTTSILESASSSSTKKTSTSSEIKETSTSVSMTSTGTQTVATPTASSEASQTEIMVFCAIAGAIIMYFL
ncbi:hypothetical protein JMJ77_0014784 [Colletotrichum scovillei]|uniref:Uncharacterized protein n=1 Tax=Colletotrichum scovillei TaxID=1209932 RepID=A0A9P7U9X0_9PEZI|nr:hypothetical protein JMJ77_0014784 [Colletotrichum scovillei]KAG7056396.1 hypothetical protein JMJ78_0000197 [Colletotrichum scovillei]KAG7066327.1 hypothetical protein JMJ76_0000191 [Colletotrichum scovillei]